MDDSFQSRMIAAYPETTWPTIVRGIGEGVRIADEVLRSTPFLSTAVGRDLRGFVRRAAIMWRLQTLCRGGELPFQAKEVVNTNGASHLLSILSNNIEMHVVRTDDADSFPIDAPIRQDHRVTNIPDLFSDPKIIPLDKALEGVPMLYGWIAWGATKKGDLTHVSLEMPENLKDHWLAHRDILRHVLAKHTEGKKGKSRTSSAPNPADLLKFKAAIARELRRKDQQGNGPAEGDDG